MGDDWMQLWVNAAQMKAADQYTIQKLGVPSLELMEHAAQNFRMMAMKSYREYQNVK